MKQTSLYPMKLDPTIKDNIWGGIKLRTLFNRQSQLPRLAESWNFPTRVLNIEKALDVNIMEPVETEEENSHLIVFEGYTRR